jgi:hypothetical protein
MKRFIATIFVLSALASALAYQSIIQPKATASPAPAIDHSAELAALKSEISNLKSELAAANLPAAQVAEPDAPAAVARPAGVRTTAPSAPALLPTAHSAERIGVVNTSLPRHHLSSPQCAGGACGVQPAAAPKRYAAPVRQRRVFSGRLFGRR